MRRLLPTLGPSVGAAAVAGGLFLITPYALMVMAPALALAWVVAMGLFTGERAAEWVRRAVRRLRPRRAQATATAAPRRPRTNALRGGLLMAAALASRPPPALS
ncbi:MAG: hypothetical protein JHD16_02295 [Solirubrobacteraceae bacterium]|nr:hypothetical protein [Solirubrobacteraceae bacterium]